MIIRLIIFSIIWMIFAQGQLNSLIVGLPAIVLASVISCRLADKNVGSFSLVGFLKFSVFFVKESFKGGLDIARRVYSKDLDIDPKYVVYESTLPTRFQRLFLSCCISLLPGTLTASLIGKTVIIHSLINAENVKQEVAQCEQVIANMFPAATDGKYVEPVS